MPRDCSKCGTSNADEGRFCRACGAALTAPAAAAPAPCRSCGHPNLAGARFCARCGTDQTTSDPPPAPAALPAAGSNAPKAARPMRRWIGLGAVVVALAAGGAWWMNQTRSAAAPNFDAAPPPPAFDASSGPSASTPASVEAPASAAAPPTSPTPVPATAPSASAASGELPAPADTSAPAARPPAKEPQAASDKTVRDAKAKALREPRQLGASQAATEGARRHAEETGARPVPHPAAPMPAAPEPVRSVQLRCVGRNAILQGLCEARECLRNENANDAVCQRIRADAEQRRQ